MSMLWHGIVAFSQIWSKILEQKLKQKNLKGLYFEQKASLVRVSCIEFPAFHEYYLYGPILF